jgi:hypothetical protein
VSAVNELIKLRKKQAAKAAQVRSYKTWDMKEFLFKEQWDFVTDQKRFVTAVCSVRAGKSVACAADLMDTALRMPGTLGIYITLARPAAERVIWPELKRLNDTFGFGVQFNEAKLSARFPNGSIIYCMGAPHEEEIEKIRGLSKVALVYLDEAQAFRPFIKGLVEDIVTKRLYDTNGRCRVIGTPGPVLSGYFYDTANNPQWGHHSWTLFNNPHIQAMSGMSAMELTLQDCKTRGVAIDHPSIQRENFGRWVYDPDALILHYEQSLNHYEHLPEDRYDYILGIDSLSLLAYSPASPCTWLVAEMVTPNQGTDALASQIKDLQAKYGDMRMVADTGALGKKIAIDLVYRYGFVIEPADKLGKAGDYRLLDNALRSGMFRAKKGSKFAEDCNLLEVDREKTTPDRIVVKGHSDAVDSALYAFVLSPAYDWKPPPLRTLPGTPEYEREQMNLHKEAMRERIKRDQALKDGVAQGFPKDASGKDPWHSWED